MADKLFNRFFWVALGAVCIVFHLVLIFSGLVPNLVSRPIHMALALPWVFLLADQYRWQTISGILFTVLGIVCCIYITINHNSLGDQYGYISNKLQLVIGCSLLTIVLEMARRVVGWPLPCVALLALLYGLFGNHIPGEFGHPGYPINSFIGTLTIAEGGVWGKLTGISVNIVAIFVIMGVVLNAGEAGQGFMNLASVAAGRLKGGAAKVSVVSSALFGSISGSASANVASTGVITLPAMVRLGYPKSFAAAVEAVASSGGQIMPPLMGAGAFVMVELTGVPYTQIMTAAILPALLYFFTVWMGINAFCQRYDLKAISSSDIASRRAVIITSLFFAIPFIVLLERMFIGGYTPQYAACVAILAAFLLLFVDKNFEFSHKLLLSRIEQTCTNAGKQISLIASIILCASIIIGVLGQTGLGVKITSLILSASGGTLWPALLLTALACLILGMEVPTTAAYVICISIAGPALQQLGLDLLHAHLFVFWFALLSTITPPVCGAVFIAAGMLNENWLKVAFSAMALGLGLYLIPIFMISNPAIIQLDQKPLSAFTAFVQAGIGLSLISYGVIAKREFLSRILLVLGGLVVLFFGTFAAN